MLRYSRGGGGGGGPQGKNLTRNTSLFKHPVIVRLRRCRALVACLSAKAEPEEGMKNSKVGVVAGGKGRWGRGQTSSRKGRKGRDEQKRNRKAWGGGEE